MTLQRLAEAQKLLRVGRFGEAVRNLGTILDADEDFFFQPDRDEPIHRSLKAEARQLIGSMPVEGRELYELQYGPQARRMLAEAVAAGDMTRLAEVSRRFYHTEAGYEATLLLGLHHLDHGRPLAGALTLDRLHSMPNNDARFQPALSLAAAAGWYQAGGVDRAARILTVLKESRKGSPVRLGGREVPWFASAEDAADWLAGHVGTQPSDTSEAARQWLMARGNPSRNASSPGGSPLLNVRWEVPVADDPVIERFLAQQQQQNMEQGVPPIPELHPLVVDDVALMRTTRNLLAVDVRTGKRLWEVPVDDPLESLLHLSPDDQRLRGQLQHVPLAMRERVLQDKTFGSISSDGQHVFTIEDLTPSTGLPQTRQMVRGAVRVMPGQPEPYNRLASHEIRTGKLKWHLGGSGDEFALRMAETFFLGPPLPLRGQLFVLAETKEEIRLLALDAATGDLLWAQPLAMVEQGVLHSPVRRLSGLSPAYADGIMVCPTSAGAVVAVDLATRSLLWGYRYSQSIVTRQRVPFFAVQFGVYPGQQGATRWADANPIISDGRVLVTPMESDSLYCLDLVDGRQHWSASREDDLFVACVHQGSVVLVGRQRVRALGLADGKPAWEGRTLEFPDGGMPSGHGFYSGSRYFIPLTTAEILAVDLDHGRTAHVARSRQGQVPGNLVSYEGLVLSQSAGGLAAYYQLEVLGKEVAERLAKDPADAGALALHGELLLDQGKRDEAIRSLDHSYRLASDRRTADLLREALLDGLRNDFDAFRGRAAEIEPLLSEPSEQAEFLRVMANGLHRAGQWSAAFEHYMKLIEFDEDRRRVEPVDKTLSVRGDRWIRARLATLRAEASGDEAAEIERLIALRMQDAVEANTVEGLVRFLDYFGDDSGTDPARDALVRTLTDAGKLLEVEMALWSKPSATGASPGGAAAARLAELFAQSEHEAEAKAAYRYLAERYADVVCLEGKTGRELINALPDGHLGHPLSGADPIWPEGRIDVQEIAANRPPTQGRYPLDFRGDPGPFFRDTVIRMDQSRRAVSATDGFGNVRWSAPLVEPGSPHSFAFNPATTYVRACGHLLVMSLGYRIIAIDALGQPGRGQVRVLWSQDLTQGGFDQTLLRIAMAGGPQFPQGVAIVQHGSHQLGSLGPVTSRYVCFQHYRNLVAADPITGETLWVRHGVPLGSTLFGDEEYVLAAAPEQRDIIVLSALDGSLVGQRSLPAPERLAGEPDEVLPAVQRRFGQAVMTTLGRYIVVSYVDPADGQQVLGLYDPVEQYYVWGPMRTAIGKTAYLNEELLGSLGPDGVLKLIRMHDGRVIFDEKLAGEATATEMHLVRAGSRYLVVTNRPRIQDQARRINPLPGTHYRPIGSGRVYAFDMEGQLLWPKPAIVETQLLVLHQPEDLPVFVFASQSYDPQRAGAERFTTRVACLDKRNGRMVYRGSFTGPTATFEVVGDPETNSIEIQLQQNVVRFQLTDTPLSPEELEAAEGMDDQSGVDSPPVKPSAAILKAIGGALRQAGAIAGGASDVLPRWPEPLEPEPNP
ncbi:MAG: PQQ-binding-like beta-propeller repeat protein [Thermoguttaceae bacterium]|jgi:outer membrane protein assembly factor BamB|nr:PQQ-binding-like beta-propeller repeat protein [Thermoguttaceae bacterium]